MANWYEQSEDEILPPFSAPFRRDDSDDEVLEEQFLGLDLGGLDGTNYGATPMVRERLPQKPAYTPSPILPPREQDNEADFPDQFSPTDLGFIDGTDYSMTPNAGQDPQSNDSNELHDSSESQDREPFFPTPDGKRPKVKAPFYPTPDGKLPTAQPQPSMSLAAKKAPMQQQMPNTPRDPDNPDEKLKTYLRQKMRAQELMSDPEYRDLSRGASMKMQDSTRDLGLANLLQKSAAQMGTIGGKVADTSPGENYTKQLIGQNQSTMDQIGADRKAYSDEDDKTLKIKQYLANKFSTEKMKSADLQARRESEARRQENTDRGFAQRERHHADSLDKQGADRERNSPSNKGRAQFVTDTYRRMSYKSSLKSNIEGFVAGMDSAKTPHDKIRIANLALKSLNSINGQDAVGIEEAKRIGSDLEFKWFNFTQKPGSVTGRDIEEFKGMMQRTVEVIATSLQLDSKTVKDFEARGGDIFDNPKAEAAPTTPAAKPTSIDPPKPLEQMNKKELDAYEAQLDAINGEGA